MRTRPLSSRVRQNPQHTAVIPARQTQRRAGAAPMRGAPQARGDRGARPVVCALHSQTTGSSVGQLQPRRYGSTSTSSSCTPPEAFVVADVLKTSCTVPPFFSSEAARSVAKGVGSATRQSPLAPMSVFDAIWITYAGLFFGRNRRPV